MRASRRSLTLFTLGLLPVACAVYDDGTLGLRSMGDPSSSPGVGASAGTTATGGSKSAGGNSAANAGSSTGGTAGASGAGNGGKTSVIAGSAGQIGTSFGGESGGDGSDGGDATGGTATTGKAGGEAGGAAGHGGVASGNGGSASNAGSGGVSGAGGAAGTSSAAGAGGMPSTPLCSDHPLTARSSWVATASIYDSDHDGVPANLLDSKTTRWSTGKPQAGDEWLQLDFGATVTLNNINLQQGSDTNDYPRAYSVIVSATAKDLSGSVRVNGSGKSGASTVIVLPALASGRYLLIKQTGSSLSWWSAEEIEVSCSD